MASIDNKNLTNLDNSVNGVLPQMGSQISQLNSPAQTETPLFEGTSSTEGISTTDRTDAYIKSGTSGAAQSSEMTALTTQLTEKQSALSNIDSQIEANNTLKEEMKSAYTTAGETVSTTLAAYKTAAQNYSAALSELNELKNANIFEAIFNTITQKVKQAEAKVAELKKQAQEAHEQYEQAIEDRNTAREEYMDAIEEGMTLKENRANIADEIAAIQKEIQDLSQKEAEQQAKAEDSTQNTTQTGGTNEDNNSVKTNNQSSNLSILQEAAKNNPELQAALDMYGENITDADMEELSLMYGVKLNSTGNVDADDNTKPPTNTGSNESTNIDSSYEDDLAALEQLKEDAKQEAEDFLKQPDITQMDETDVDKLVEIFCGELTHEDVQHLGLELIDMVDEAAKIFETKLTASVYSKSGAMATADSASAKEHSEAQTSFTEAVLQVSDIVNNTNVEFYNVSDKSNFELASRTLDRINDGEYIKTADLEKQTSIVKNIRVVDNSNEETSETNDNKYEQYSDAILDELHNLISSSEGGITEDEYNAIKTSFDEKATQDMESAFDYLENEARKHNITSAINRYDA